MKTKTPSTNLYQFTDEYDQLFFKEVQNSKHNINHDNEAKVIRAKKIITMNPMQPYANTVAVQDGKIFYVSSYDDVINCLKLKKIKYKEINDFCNSYIIPGLIESHCHTTMLGVNLQFKFVGPFQMKDHEGKTIGGFTTKQDVIKCLSDYSKKTDTKFVVGWGYDPGLVTDKDPLINRYNLDKIDSKRPVCVMNASSHIAYVNSAALELGGIDESTDIEGVIKDDKGIPTGELRELQAMGPILEHIFNIDSDTLCKGIINVGQIAKNAGVTTISELGLGLIPNCWNPVCKATSMDDFPVRYSVYIFNDYLKEDGDSVENFYNAKSYENDNLRIAGVKLVTDGSIQGYTAYMKWPYYYNSNENGILNTGFEKIYLLLKEYLAAGIQCSIHTNGSGAIENTIKAVEHILKFIPDRDARVRLEHVQTINETNLSKMKKYGILPSFFVNHLYYWGDFHAKNTIGEAGAAMMNPLASAIRHNLKFSLHSDAPINPIDPLRSIWCAVTRKSISGVVHGPDERISVYDALKSVTIDAANILKEEEIKGSIEIGKLADLAILDKDILKVDYDEIPNIKVQATVKGGKIFKN